MKKRIFLLPLWLLSPVAILLILGIKALPRLLPSEGSLAVEKSAIEAVNRYLASSSDDAPQKVTDAYWFYDMRESDTIGVQPFTYILRRSTQKLLVPGIGFFRIDDAGNVTQVDEAELSTPPSAQAVEDFLDVGWHKVQNVIGIRESIASVYLLTCGKYEWTAYYATASEGYYYSYSLESGDESLIPEQVNYTLMAWNTDRAYDFLREHHRMPENGEDIISDALRYQLRAHPEIDLDALLLLLPIVFSPILLIVSGKRKKKKCQTCDFGMEAASVEQKG